MKVLSSIFLITLLGFNAFADEQNPTAPKNKSNEVINSLEDVYQALYGIDYRKLNIEDFKVYSGALNQIQKIKGDVEILLNSGSAKVEHELVEVVMNKFYGAYGFNSCEESLAPSLETLLESFKEDAIRECYASGASSCEVKLQERLKLAKNLGKNFYSEGWMYKCEVTLDVVLAVTR